MKKPVGSATPSRTADTTARIICGDVRCMNELEDASVHLAITSPPYWQIKDYGAPAQIGYGQSLHEYLIDLSRVWAECYRVLRPGRRLCVNIGDQFARASTYGRYKIIPLHTEVVAQCESLGFDYMGAIIWQKKTTMNTTGGAVVMGSFPYPPNGIVELDYEFILLFKKPGTSAPASVEQKAASRLTTEEWKEYFAGHWHFAGTRQVYHEAMFPDELPRRLMRMFSFDGETVLDPFLGSGTTIKVALELGRNAIGYEVQPEFLPIIRGKLGWANQRELPSNIVFEERITRLAPVAAPAQYKPQVQDANPMAQRGNHPVHAEQRYKVCEVLDEKTLRLDTGTIITLLGIQVPPERSIEARDYLKSHVLGKSVFVRTDSDSTGFKVRREIRKSVPVYLVLSNGLFINRKMIEMGLAKSEPTCRHRHSAKFVKAQEKVLP
jgi:DNA modification methylase